MDELISFDLEEEGVVTCRVKNLRINPNLEYFNNTVKFSGQKYRINISLGYISVFRVGLFENETRLFFFKHMSSYNKRRCELVKELLSLSKDKMQQYADKVKERMNKVEDWKTQRKVYSFKI